MRILTNAPYSMVHVKHLLRQKLKISGCSRQEIHQTITNYNFTQNQPSERCLIHQKEAKRNGPVTCQATVIERMFLVLIGRVVYFYFSSFLHSVYCIFNILSKKNWMIQKGQEEHYYKVIKPVVGKKLWQKKLNTMIEKL